MAGFALFSSLPTEIRLKIWLEAIADDEPEVCLTWPGDVPGQVVEDDPLSELPVLPLTVDTAFPVTMHVCRESRALTQDSSLSGVRFRASHLARCMTPFRRFNPDLDFLYMSHDTIWHLLLFSDPDATKLSRAAAGSAARRCYDDFMSVLRALKRLALNIALLYTNYTDINVFLGEHAEAPEYLAIVIPGTTPYIGSDKNPLGFVPPGKRCRLVPVPEAARDNLMVQIDNDPTVVTLGAAMCGAEKELRGWCDDIPNLRAVLDRLQISAQTFVEYQKRNLARGLHTENVPPAASSGFKRIRAPGQTSQPRACKSIRR